MGLQIDGDGSGEGREVGRRRGQEEYEKRIGLNKMDAGIRGRIV